MLMLTRMPTRSKCMCGSSVEMIEGSATTMVSLGCADAGRASTGVTAVVGFVDRRDDIFNAAAVLSDGRLGGVYHKQFLPNYGVFDENRYFQAGTESPVFEFGESVFAVNICEDIWYP